ncbi:MAG: hypothetical protein AB1349_09940, partial [Elusimicrobiota bacterium]
QVDLCKIAILLDKYKNKYDTYPISLEKLKPEFIAQIPVDPITGKNYTYKKEAKTYSLGIEEEKKPVPKPPERKKSAEPDVIEVH